jgi:ATP-dependent DNA helicase RecG
MTPTELAELLRNGEDSTLEFKRDDVPNHELARELVAFLNLEGGTVLLGVEDDAQISGTTRQRLDEWVSELCRTKIEPPVVPLLSWVRDAEPGRDVLAVRVTLGPNKPYARVHDGRKTYFIRVNNTVREASREELERMFQASGRLHYGLKPVPGADFAAFDLRRLRDYFTRILRGPAPADDDLLGWETLLANVELMTENAGQRVATIDGMLLFGRVTKRFVLQSGIRAICYPGTEPDYATHADEDLRAPMVPLASTDGTIIEPGLVEQAWDFIRRNTTPTSTLEGGRRIDRWEFPEAVVREAVVNALVHRDYSIAGTDILLAIFEDRLEIQSPGRLPNTVTLEGMKAGMRYARNQTLVNVMRDYGYVDARGMGVRNKIIPGMRAHNGTEPDILAEESRVTIRLWRRARQA